MEMEFISEPVNTLSNSAPQFSICNALISPLVKGSEKLEFYWIQIESGDLENRNGMVICFKNGV